MRTISGSEGFSAWNRLTICCDRYRSPSRKAWRSLFALRRRSLEAVAQEASPSTAECAMAFAAEGRPQAETRVPSTSRSVSRPTTRKSAFDTTSTAGHSQVWLPIRMPSASTVTVESHFMAIREDCSAYRGPPIAKGSLQETTTNRMTTLNRGSRYRGRKPRRCAFGHGIRRARTESTAGKRRSTNATGPRASNESRSVSSQGFAVAH